ncbi:hypothetical protein, partial [Methanoculleus sp.]|uniref:hypothetical protein n=1 Tax=Methanoculleus sp. TaxID=90427 RepID=UPI001BD542A0
HLTVVELRSCGTSHSHLSVLKLAALALRTLRVLVLRAFRPSHSPSALPRVAIVPRKPCYV